MPSMFIAHEPQMPSRHERRNVSVGSISFLILISASRTIGPQLSMSTSYVSTRGFSPAVRIEAVDLELRARSSRPRRRRGLLAGLDLRVRGK